jgi:hypothetical protein
MGIYLPKNVWTLRDITVPMGQCQPKALMLIDYFGKRLFPRLQPSQYGLKFKIIAASVVFGLVAGGVLAVMMVLRGAAGG